MPLNEKAEKKLILFLKKNKEFKTFIETGLNKGDGIIKILSLKDSPFEVIYSMEFYKSYIERFSKQISNNKINFICGSSDVSMKNFVEKPNHKKDKLIVFLDAHGHNSEVSPLIGEIEALATHNQEMVIMVDDGWFIENAPNRPTRAPWATKIGGIVRFNNFINFSFKDRILLFEKLYYLKTEKHNHDGKNYVMWIHIGEKTEK